MRRIVLDAAPAQLSLACGAVRVGCRWLWSALALFMLASSVCADEPTEGDAPDAVPASGVVIRLQLAPSVKSTALEVEVGPEVEVEVGPEVEVDAESAKVSAMSVQFRGQAGRLSSRGQSKHTLPLRSTPPERHAPAPAPAKTLHQATERSVAASQRANTRPLTLELHPPLEPSPREGETSDKFDSLESSSDIEPSQWDLSLDAPAAVPYRGTTVARQEASSESRAQVSDLSNERPLDGLAESAAAPLEPDDVPLSHEPHPFDAPKGESIAPIVKRSALPAEVFSERELRIEAGIARCLNYYMANPENTVRRGPWALMHATLPFGVEGEVIAGNRRVNTIGWLSFNGTSGKQHMFQPTRTGFRPNVGPGVQGHEGQFLAILAQSKVRGDFPLQVNGRNYTVMDLARHEMATCREKSELTFKLIGLSRYLEPDAQWRDNRGRSWTLEKVLVEEMAQPINGAACGGVHRLMGLSYAVIERQAAGQPISGNWQRAQAYVDNYVQYTLTLQNTDGSFSTNWFESRGMDPSVERRVQTSGHILEWLVYTLPDEHLRSPQIQQGMEFLLNSIGREPQRDWPIGPRGHALRAMALYSQRVFGAEPGDLKSYLADATQADSVR